MEQDRRLDEADVEERDTTIEELQAKLALATPGKSDPRPPRGPGYKYPRLRGGKPTGAIMEQDRRLDEARRVRLECDRKRQRAQPSPLPFRRTKTGWILAVYGRGRAYQHEVLR